MLSGYEDGTVRPNQPVTRAEFVALVNRAFGFSSGSTVEFPDVEPGSWSYQAVASAVYEGYISGYEDGTFRPDREVSRQEVAVMVSNIVHLTGMDTGQAANRFSDADKIAPWSFAAVDAVAHAEIMRGYEDGSFKPTDSITRAEAVVTIDQAVSVFEEHWAAVYSVAGTYGPERGTETIEGNVLVKADGVTLQNLEITGDLLLGHGIGEGDATLENVTVKGTTTVQGGGVNSIHISNSDLIKVTVNKNGDVRIVAANSDIEELVVADGGQVILSGNYSRVYVHVPNVELVLEDGTVDELTVAEEAAAASIHVAKGASIKTLTLNAATRVTGSGTIDKAIIHAAGCTFEQQPRSIELADGITVEVGGEQITESTRPYFGGTTSRGRSGGGSRNTVEVVNELHDVWMLVGEGDFSWFFYTKM